MKKKSIYVMIILVILLTVFLLNRFLFHKKDLVIHTIVTVDCPMEIVRISEANQWVLYQADLIQNGEYTFTQYEQMEDGKMILKINENEVSILEYVDADERVTVEISFDVAKEQLFVEVKSKLFKNNRKQTMIQL